MARVPPGGWAGGLVALVAIFLPGFLLTAGTLAYWSTLRERTRVRRAVAGVNAAVTGLLFAALCTPVITGGIKGWGDLVLALAAFLALRWGNAPPLAVVLAGALLGAAIG